MEKKKDPEAMAEIMRKIRLSSPPMTSEEAAAQRRAMMKTGPAAKDAGEKKQAA